jgi:hypothetical protein
MMLASDSVAEVLDEDGIAVELVADKQTRERLPMQATPQGVMLERLGPDGTLRAA